VRDISLMLDANVARPVPVLRHHGRRAGCDTHPAIHSFVI